MSILDAYSEDFSTKCQEISNSISELKDCATTDRDKSSSIVRQIDGLISQADKSIKQMELEVRSQDLSTRKALTEKMSLYKKTLLSHRSDFERAKEKAERSDLIGAKSSEQRDKYIGTNEKILQQNQTIENAIRTVAETEEVGQEITREMIRNRETINSSNEKVTDMKGIIERATKISKGMERRENCLIS